MNGKTVQANVHLDTQNQAGPIDRRVFGGFLEHMGRAVYEGIYDPGSVRSDERGFRRDVLEALRPLAMPVMRYPGGNFVSCYDWRDGIGPRESRPRRPDYAWRSIETNQFGVDEFIAWAADLGAQPMLAVNLGTAGTTDAAQLLEYCNLSGGIYWADQRRRNGHAEPYGVKLWCLGNEMDGPWQAGHVPAPVYAQRAQQAALVMKGLDPTIETVLCGSSGRSLDTYMEWDRTALEYCWDHVDYISAHRYSENRRGDSAWFLAEGVEIDRILDDYAALLNYVRAVKKSDKRVYLSFDEWNVWYKAMAMDGAWSQAPHLIEEHYNLEDALVCAQYLTSFLRHADIVKMACLAQIVNVIAPILTRPDGLLIQSIYHPFHLFAQHAQGLSLRPAVSSPTYPAGQRGEAPVLDAAASYDPDAGAATVFLVNRNLAEQLWVTVDVADRRIAHIDGVDVFGGSDVKAANTWEAPDVLVPFRGEAVRCDDGTARVRVPSPGLAVVRMTLDSANYLNQDL
jgi:alpha-N-arabinofuranosidase